MKKTFTIILAALLPALAWGQAQINTKKMKIADFTQKITKVVLTGNEFFDMALQNEITMGWRISPYEFCTMEEFEEYRTSDEFYFLVSVDGKFRKDNIPTISYLTLVKGGQGAEGGIDKMLEVVSMPVASAQSPSGREFVFLPALLEIIQNYTLASMENDVNAYGGLGTITQKIEKGSGFMAVFTEEDICPSVYDMEKVEFSEDELFITDENKADSYMLDRADNTLVGYVVAPSEPMPGATYYKMLINARTYQLYYFAQDKVSRKEGAGFMPADIKKIYTAITNY
ncbi:MAG: hypothetical protein IJN30_00840 [Bacteroidales bacterium]|nr:hypothetical protein [Bacteroidales bacterium]